MPEYNEYLLEHYALTPPTNPPQNPSQQSFVKGDIGGVAFNVEFNDSVLSTQGWNNPRYNGSKVETQILNQYTDGDITFDKSVGVQKYTRNFYLGRIITFLDNSPTDSAITEFPGGAYVILDTIKTVNPDNTLETAYTINANSPSYVKTGFYRTFFDDFPVGGNVSIHLLDSTVPNALKESYNVYFNKGLLIRQITGKNLIHTNGQVALQDYGGFRYFQYSNSFADSGNITSDFTIDLNTDQTTQFTTTTSVTTYAGLESVFDDLLAYKGEDYANRNFYVTPILNSNPYSFTDFDSNHTNRRAFNIFELSGTSHSDRQINISAQYGIGGDEYNGESNKGYIISRAIDSVPCLLLKLPTTDLPSGVGNLPFVVIPSNLHPVIKDNIEYFAQRANINIPTNDVIKFDPRNSQLR